jgi:pimeloyl-ACP methyl ester carboxylesterase
MGGNSAYLTAASHPELVTALIVVEASPYGPVPGLPDHIRRWLDSWPTPFADQEAAREFFASQGFAPEAWAEGLELRPDGLWPAFNRDTLIACMDDLAARDYWREWRSIRCPTLLVRGERGNFEDDHFAELARLLPAASCVTIRGAGHDVHLDAPRELAEEVGAWLAPTGGEPHGDHPKLA